MSTTTPKTGETWQHQDHDEGAGLFLQHKIIAIAEPGNVPKGWAVPRMIDGFCAETNGRILVIFAGGKIFTSPALDELSVIYENIIPMTLGFIGDRLVALWGCAMGSHGFQGLTRELECFKAIQV